MNKILRAFRNSPPILVSIILVLLIEHCTKCFCCMLEFLTTMAAMVMIVVSPRYFRCPPFTMGLSPLKKCISEICRFAPIFQGNNCFRVIYLGEICTLKAATEKKVVLKPFEGQGLIGLCAKFQLCQS